MVLRPLPPAKAEEMRARKRREQIGRGRGILKSVSIQWSVCSVGVEGAHGTEVGCVEKLKGPTCESARRATGKRSKGCDYLRRRRQRHPAKMPSEIRATDEGSGTI